MANDDELVEQIKLAGRMAGENYWQLPSLPECKEAIKSDVADLLNSAGRAGGCITGGLFMVNSSTRIFRGRIWISAAPPPLPRRRASRLRAVLPLAL